jgi:antitoxin HicB
VINPAHYPVDVFYSEEDEGFIALAPDLPGCSAFGETRAEAVNEIQDAICAWIEASEKAGNPIPEPSKKSSESLPSGKILLRLPRTLHGQLVEQARREGTSLNQFLLYVITSNTSAQEIASTVVGKLMTTTAFYGGLNATTTLTSNARTGLVSIANTQFYASAGSTHTVVADSVNKVDVFTYGATKGIGRLYQGRVRAHG